MLIEKVVRKPVIRVSNKVKFKLASKEINFQVHMLIWRLTTWYVHGLFRVPIFLKHWRSRSTGFWLSQLIATGSDQVSHCYSFAQWFCNNPCILIDFAIHIDKLSLWLPIVYFKRETGRIYVYYDALLLNMLKIVLISANIADSDEMQHDATFHLGLHC